MVYGDPNTDTFSGSTRYHVKICLFLSISHLFLPSPGIQSDLDRQLMEEQWEMLCQMMGDKTAFVFGKQGCLTDTELHTALKVGSEEKHEEHIVAQF